MGLGDRAFNDALNVIAGKKPGGEQWIEEMEGAALWFLGDWELAPDLDKTPEGLFKYAEKHPDAFDTATDNDIYYFNELFLVHAIRKPDIFLIRYVILGEEVVFFPPWSMEIKRDWSAYGYEKWALSGDQLQRSRRSALEFVAQTVDLFVKSTVARDQCVGWAVEGGDWNAFSGILRLPPKWGT